MDKVIMHHLQFLKVQLAFTSTILRDIERKCETVSIGDRDDEQSKFTLMCIDGFLIHFEQGLYTILKYFGGVEQELARKLFIWKHEQQRSMNKVVGSNGTPLHRFSVSLDTLQSCCEELVELIWETFEQLKRAEQMLKTCGPVIARENHLSYIVEQVKEVTGLMQRFLNNCFIVEEQPPQILATNRKFEKVVSVSLLLGKRYNMVHIVENVETKIISEGQAKTLSTSEIAESIGEFVMAEKDKIREDTERFTTTFRNLRLRSIKESERKASSRSGNHRVMEKKACLYFECVVRVGKGPFLEFKLSTISLPVVVISNTSQEGLALATIMWDNAFAETGRVPFLVPDAVPWAGVAPLLNAKIYEVTGRGLFRENLECLAKKAFRHQEPQPEIITWFQFCKDPLPNSRTTFWGWFHAALKTMLKKGTLLKELWSDGLIHGFIERDEAEKLISHLEPGTFLIRFSDSLPGAVTICMVKEPKVVVNLQPYTVLQLQATPITRCIRDMEQLKYLYRPQAGVVPKDEVFSKYYTDDDESIDVS